MNIVEIDFNIYFDGYFLNLFVYDKLANMFLKEVNFLASKLVLVT